MTNECSELPCERLWDHDGWWCINDHTGCLHNDGNNTCLHGGCSLSPLADQPSPLDRFLDSLTNKVA